MKEDVNEALFCRGQRGQGVDEFEIWYEHQTGEQWRECDDSPECVQDHSEANEDSPTFVRLWDYMDLMLDFDELLEELRYLRGQLDE